MSEQRREHRFEPDTPVSIHFLGSDGDMPEAVGFISNVSPHGVLISTNATNSPAVSKEPLRVRLHVGGSQSFDLLGEVRWRKPIGYHNELGLLLFESKGTDYLLWQNHVNRQNPQRYSA